MRADNKRNFSVNFECRITNSHAIRLFEPAASEGENNRTLLATPSSYIVSRANLVNLSDESDLQKTSFMPNWICRLGSLVLRIVPNCAVP